MYLLMTPHQFVAMTPTVSLGSSILDGVEVVADQLVHGEHVDGILLKYFAHLLVTDNLALVARVLEIMLLDVFPELLDNLGSG